MQNDELFQYDSFPIPQPEDQENDDAGTPIETVDADGKRQLIGYAVVWGAVSSVMRDGFKHRFARGSIKWQTPTAALWHHDYASPLGSTSNSTLTISEDEHGVKVVIDLDATTDGTNAFTRVKNKQVSGMSFGGRRLAYDRTDDPKIIDIISFVADEVSVTMVPAMSETIVTTAGQKEDLQKSVETKKDFAMQMQKMKLDKIKLSMLKPSRVFG